MNFRLTLDSLEARRTPTTSAATTFTPTSGGDLSLGFTPTSPAPTTPGTPLTGVGDGSSSNGGDLTAPWDPNSDLLSTDGDNWNGF